MQGSVHNSAKHLRDASQMSIFQVFDQSSSFWWLIHFYSDDAANFGCYVIVKFAYLLFRRARRALFSDVFTDTAKMPSPIWEVGRTKKEVVRFNQGGYICPAHNYEPWRRRIGLGTDGSAVSGCASQQVYVSQLFERTLQSYKAVPDVSDRTWAAWSADGQHASGEELPLALAPLSPR